MKCHLGPNDTSPFPLTIDLKKEASQETLTPTSYSVSQRSSWGNQKYMPILISQLNTQQKPFTVSHCYLLYELLSTHAMTFWGWNTPDSNSSIMRRMLSDKLSYILQFVISSWKTGVLFSWAAFIIPCSRPLHWWPHVQFLKFSLLVSTLRLELIFHNGFWMRHGSICDYFSLYPKILAELRK